MTNSVISKKWGLCPHYLKDHPELSQLLTRANYRASRYFGHKPLLRDGHLFLPFKGAWLHWKELLNLGALAWGRKGLVEVGETLSHFAPSVEGHQLEILTSGSLLGMCRLRSTLHAWIRLYDGQGHVMSAGYAGVRQRRNIGSFFSHLLPQPATVHLPDQMEFELSHLLKNPDELSAHRLSLTPSQYQELMERLRIEKEQPGRYQLFGLGGARNCVTFIYSLAREINIRLPGSPTTPLGLRQAMREVGKESTYKLKPL